MEGGGFSTGFQNSYRARLNRVVGVGLQPSVPVDTLSRGKQNFFSSGTSIGCGTLDSQPLSEEFREGNVLVSPNSSLSLSFHTLSCFLDRFSPVVTSWKSPVSGLLDPLYTGRIRGGKGKAGYPCVEPPSTPPLVSSQEFVCG